MSLQATQKARRNYATEAFLGRDCSEILLYPQVESLTHTQSILLTSPTSLPPLHSSSQGPSHPAQVPQLPWSSPSHHPPSPSAWEVPWSPGMGRSLWPTETSRTGRPRKKSALRGLKIRCGLWEIMTIPSLTACRTNCKAHLPDPGFPLLSPSLFLIFSC